MNTEIEKQNPSFYVAVIVYEFSSDTPQCQPLYREDIVLIKASTLEDAQQKTLQLAQKQETVYKNELGENITLTLKHVVDVSPILSENFVHGADMYARHFRNYQAYIAFEPFLSGEPVAQTSFSGLNEIEIGNKEPENDRI